MKTLPILLLILTFNSYAQTIAEVKKFIPNFAKVGKSGQVYRGKQPKKAGSIEALKNLGITDVISFKNDLHGEVASELEEVESLGMNSLHIEFKWKDIDFNLACEQTIEALNKIDEVVKKDGKVFFHCTAGEDRTGLLAGVYKIRTEKMSTQEAFEKEMCANGYSDGNPGKNGMVSGPIQKGLTPLYLAIADKIQSGAWKKGKLSKTLCKSIKLEPTKLTCKKSKDFFAGNL